MIHLKALRCLKVVQERVSFSNSEMDQPYHHPHQLQNKHHTIADVVVLPLLFGQSVHEECIQVNQAPDSHWHSPA